MEVHVLGPLRVHQGGDPLPIGGPKQQAMLGVLVAHAGKVVSTDRLIDELWGDAPPETARKSVQVYAARLRRVLGADRLRGVAPGYVLDLAGVEVDAARFEALLAGARDTLDRDPADGLQRIDAALALWRGAPYGELADEVPTLRVESTRLDELRLVALEPGCCWRGWRCSTTRSRCRR